VAVQQNKKPVKSCYSDFSFRKNSSFFIRGPLRN